MNDGFSKVPTLEDELKAIKLQLRYAASEFRSFRSLSPEQLRERMNGQIVVVSNLLLLAVACGGLKTIHGIEEFRQPHPDSPQSAKYDLRSMFFGIIGYAQPYEMQSFPGYYFLRPGLLSRHTSVLQMISVGILRNPSELELEEARERKNFEVLGYYAHSCETIADILESEENTRGKPNDSIETITTEATKKPPSDYVRLWDYANKTWSKGSDNFRICEVIANGPGNYTECVNALLPKVSRTEQTKRFHSVVGKLNKAIRVELGLEVYRDKEHKEQVLIRNATDASQPEHKQKRSTKKVVKKSGTKRKP